MTSDYSQNPHIRLNNLHIYGRALVVALIIGTVLNLINQGDAIIRFQDISIAKLVLTYLVPFFVLVHGAFSAKAHLRKGFPATGNEIS